MCFLWGELQIDAKYSNLEIFIKGIFSDSNNIFLRYESGDINKKKQKQKQKKNTFESALYSMSGDMPLTLTSGSMLLIWGNNIMNN